MPCPPVEPWLATRPVSARLPGRYSQTGTDMFVQKQEQMGIFWQVLNCTKEISDALALISMLVPIIVISIPIIVIWSNFELPPSLQHGSIHGSQHGGSQHGLTPGGFTPPGNLGVHYTRPGSSGVHYTSPGNIGVHYTPSGNLGVHYTPPGNLGVHYSPSGN